MKVSLLRALPLVWKCLQVGSIAAGGRYDNLIGNSLATDKDWLKPSVVLEAFEARAARISVACAHNLSKFDNPEEGFAELAADLAEAAIAHCQLIVVSKKNIIKYYGNKHKLNMRLVNL